MNEALKEAMKAREEQEQYADKSRMSQLKIVFLMPALITRGQRAYLEASIQTQRDNLRYQNFKLENIG